MSAATVFGEGVTIHRACADAAAARGLRRVYTIMAKVYEAGVVIPLAADAHDAAQCRVRLAEPTGWDIQLEIADRVVTVTHCSEWHRVERICSELQQIWAESHTAPAASR